MAWIDKLSYSNLKALISRGWYATLGQNPIVFWGYIITLIVIFVLGFVVLGFTEEGGWSRMLLFWGVGFLTAFFTWWMGYSNLMSGHIWQYAAMAGLSLVLIWKGGFNGIIASGVMIFILTSWIWWDPLYWIDWQWW